LLPVTRDLQSLHEQTSLARKINMVVKDGKQRMQIAQGGAKS